MKNPLSDGEVVRCGVLRLLMRCILGSKNISKIINLVLDVLE